METIALIMTRQPAVQYVFVDIGTVIEGQLHVAGTKQLPFGGQDADRVLSQLLEERGIRLAGSEVTRLKEACARLTSDDADDEVQELGGVRGSWS